PIESCESGVRTAACSAEGQLPSCGRYPRREASSPSTTPQRSPGMVSSSPSPQLCSNARMTRTPTRGGGGAVAATAPTAASADAAIADVARNDQLGLPHTLHQEPGF